MLFGCQCPLLENLNQRWEGGWKIKSIKSPVSIEIMDDQRRNKLVHINWDIVLHLNLKSKSSARHPNSILGTTMGWAL